MSEHKRLVRCINNGKVEGLLGSGQYLILGEIYEVERESSDKTYYVTGKFKTNYLKNIGAFKSRFEDVAPVDTFEEGGIE